MRGLNLRTVRQQLARKGMMRAFVALVCVSFSGLPRSNPTAFSVDQPPTILIDIPNDSLWLRQVTPQVVVSDDTDPTPSFTAELNNQPYQAGTPITQAGLYELRIIARDASGNVSEETVHFQVLDEPHYTGTLSVVEWNWQTAGGYAGLDTWIILKGPFRPDSRLKSIANYPETIPVCVIFPTHLSLKVIDTEGNSLTINQILPLYAEKCEHPSAVRLSSVYYDYENDLVAIHYRVDLREHRLRAGSPAKIKVVGFGRTDLGDFTFEASTPVISDPSMRQILERVIQKNVVVPLSTSGRDKHLFCAKHKMR